MDNLISQALTFLTTTGVSFLVRIVTAILIFYVGKWIAKRIVKFANTSMTKGGMEDTLVKFLTSIMDVALMTLVIIAALSRLGIQTASFIAVLGAAGLAVGFALQGTLSNFAAGVMIVLFRPIKAGQLVEVAGVFGWVKEVQIFTTIILTPQNKQVIIANSNVLAGNIVNYSAEGHIRLDLVFGIGYDDDLRKAKRILEEIVASDERILKDPAPTVGVLELGDNSVNFAVNSFIDPEDYRAVLFDLHERVKLRFDEEGISIPYPQRDVHLYQAS